MCRETSPERGRCLRGPAPPCSRHKVSGLILPCLWGPLGLTLGSEGRNWCFVGLGLSRGLRSFLGLSLHLYECVHGRLDPQCCRLLFLSISSKFCAPYPVFPTSPGHSCILRTISVISPVCPVLMPTFSALPFMFPRPRANLWQLT